MLKASVPAGSHANAAQRGVPTTAGVFTGALLSLVLWALIVAIVLAVR